MNNSPTQNSGQVITGNAILNFRSNMLHMGLTFEIRTGMKLTRGPSCYTRIKREFGLKGSRVSVLAQYTEILMKAEQIALKEIAEGAI